MKRFLTILIGLLLFVCMGQLGQADWTYNPFTGKLDYHETGLPTAGAAGDIVYYDGSDWQVLTAGANGLVLTLNSGLPTWIASGAGSNTKVGIDAAATAGYLGAAINDGVLRFTLNQFTMVDGGNFVTVSLADNAAARTALGLAIGTDVQAQSANLNTYSGIAPSANVQTFLGAVNYAAMITQLSLTIGTNTQAHDNALDDISGLVYASGSFIALTANDDYTVRTYAQTLSDIGAAASSHAMSTHSDEDTYSISTSGDITADHVGLGGAAVNADYGINYSKTLTDTDNSWKAGLYIVPALAKTAAAMTSSGQGIWVEGRLDGTNTQNWSNTVGVRGVAAQINTEGASTGTVTGAANFYTEASINDGATVTNLYGFYISTPSVVNNKATNAYGIYIANQDAAQTLNYAIYTGTGLVRFGGNTTIAADLDVTGELGSVATLDAATETTIEAAIDTLANLTSVQGQTLTLAGNFVTQNNNVTINAVTAARTFTMNESLTVGDGNDGTITYSASSKTLTVEDDATVSQDYTSDATPTFAGITLDGGAGGDVRIYDADQSHYTSITQQAIAGNLSITLPAAAPAANNYYFGASSAGAGVWLDSAKTVIIKGVADDTAPTVSDTANGQFVVPVILNGYDLVAAEVHVYAASADSGPVSVHIYNLTQTDDMLSTPMTIDDTEFDSKDDESSRSVVDATGDDVATGDVLQVHVTDIGSASTRGLEVRLTFRLP